MSDLSKIWEEHAALFAEANELWLDAVALKKQAAEKQETAFKEFNTIIQAVNAELVRMGAVEVDIQLWLDTKPENVDKILGLKVFCTLAEKGPVLIELES